MKVFTKAFQKVPVMRKKHGSKVYEYGYVWVTLPAETAGKPAIVKVYVIEEEPIEEKLLPPLAPQAERRQRPQPAQPAPPAQLPRRESPSLLSEPEVLLEPLRAQPERAEPRLEDLWLPPFNEFTLGEEEEEGEKCRRRWPWLGRGGR